MASENSGVDAAFVDHLHYSAGQMLEISTGQEDRFTTQLAPYRPRRGHARPVLQD